MSLIDEQNKTYFVTYLKIAACILITNSHCRDIYPAYYLAVGGGWGNALFFILSGYCLAHIKLPFYNWYTKRLIRLVPAMGIMIFLSAILAEGIETVGYLGLTGAFLLYVNKYWFVFAILIYYIFFYLIFYTQDSKRIAKVLICYAAAYVALYAFFVDKSGFHIEPEGFFWFKVYFYFGVFLIGGFIRIKETEIRWILNRNDKISVITLSMLFFSSVLLWGIVYGLVTILHKAFGIQWLIHVSVFVFSTAVLLLALLFAEKFSMPKGIWKILVNLVSDSTLEIYLIQVTFLPFILTFVFPLNWLLFFLMAFMGGTLFHLILSSKQYAYVFKK